MEPAGRRLRRFDTHAPLANAVTNPLHAPALAITANGASAPTFAHDPGLPTDRRRLAPPALLASGTVQPGLTRAVVARTRSAYRRARRRVAAMRRSVFGGLLWLLAAASLAACTTPQPA